MRWLILSCNTGAGHNSCAKAIHDTVIEHGDECDIEDTLGFISGRASKFISSGHVSAYRHAPKLFGKGYSYAEHHRSLFRENSVFYNYFTKASDGIYNLILENKYDVVLCTHPFSALILTDILKHHDLDILSAFVATDFTCSPTVEQSELDLYFIPHASLTEEFVSLGIPKERIVPSGIPIRRMFFHNTLKTIAKRTFDIPSDHRHLVMALGSMGAGPMKRLTSALAKQLPNNQDLTVVCGTNTKMFKMLTKRYARLSNIHILGFVENMSLLMDSADLYVTKPGGISVTEAAVKSLPMVFIDAVAGCEEYNLRFYLSINGAVTANKLSQIAKLCSNLLSEDKQRANMSDSLKALELPDATAEIYERITHDLIENEKINIGE